MRDGPFLSNFDAKRIEDRYPDDDEVARLVSEYRRARAYLSGLVAMLRVHRPEGCGALMAFAERCPEGKMEGPVDP